MTTHAGADVSYFTEKRGRGHSTDSMPSRTRRSSVSQDVNPFADQDSLPSPGSEETDLDADYAPQLVLADPSSRIPEIVSKPHLPEDIWWSITAALDYKSAVACYNTCQGLKAMLSRSFEPLPPMANHDVFDLFSRYPFRTHHQVQFVISPHMLLPTLVQLIGKVTRLKTMILTQGNKPVSICLRTRLALHSFTSVTTLQLDGVTMATPPDMGKLVCAFPNVKALSHLYVYYKHPGRWTLDNERSIKPLMLNRLLFHDDLGFSAIHYLLSAPMLAHTLTDLSIGGTDFSFSTVIYSCESDHVMSLAHLQGLQRLFFRVYHCTAANPGHMFRDYLTRIRPKGLPTLEIIFDYDTFLFPARDPSSLTSDVAMRLCKRPHWSPLESCMEYFDTVDEILAFPNFSGICDISIYLAGIGMRNIEYIRDLASQPFPRARGRKVLCLRVKGASFDEPGIVHTVIKPGEEHPASNWAADIPRAPQTRAFPIPISLSGNQGMQPWEAPEQEERSFEERNTLSRAMGQDFATELAHLLEDLSIPEQVVVTREPDIARDKPHDDEDTPDQTPGIRDRRSLSGP